MTASPFHLVIMGVSGCGKTTLATNLASALGLPYAEADVFHPPENIHKMEAGHPLDDADRKPWLEALRDFMSKEAALGHSTIVTCSALKKQYRDILRQADGEVHFIHLTGSADICRQRMQTRKGHFMPASLLDSQFATLEALTPDEHGLCIDLALDRKTQLEEVLALVRTLLPKAPEGLADAGIIGCGVMGKSLAHNFADNGLRVAVFDLDAGKVSAAADYQDSTGFGGAILPASSWQSFVQSLSLPRTIYLLVPAGAPVDASIEALLPYLDAQDIIIDLGNSYFEDTRRREAQLREAGLHFAGCGMSGGETGARKGPALMFGGSEHAYQRTAPMLGMAAARADDGHPCFAYISTDGAGHYVKMVHNGIEYADMQLIAEAFDILTAGLGISASEAGRHFKNWQNGPLASYLISITAEILQHQDPASGLLIEHIDDKAGQKGTGAWTAQNALLIGAPSAMLAEAVYARCLSAASAMRAAGQQAFDTVPELPAYPSGFDLADDLEKALTAAKITAYSQGFGQIQLAAGKYGWQIDFASLAQVWQQGCIIRADFLKEIIQAYQANPDLQLLAADAHFAAQLRECLPAWRRINSWAVQAGIAIPALGAGLAFIDSIRQQRLPTALIQAQRDYFGAHSYRRTDKAGSFHTLWEDSGAEIQLS